MKLYLKYLVASFTFAANTGADDCAKKVDNWNTDNFSLLDGPFIDGQVYKYLLQNGNGGVLWEEGKNGVAFPGMQVITAEQSCIMTGGDSKQCTDDPKTSKRAKVFTQDTNGPVDLVFAVSTVGVCLEDPVYRLFLKYENLSRNRIASFKVQLGKGTGETFMFDDSLTFTARDGTSSLSSQNDLAALFAFGLFGKTVVGDDQHPFNGYYDPTGRASFATVLSTNQEIMASDMTQNYQALYDGSIGAWIPKEIAPYGFFYDHDRNPDTDPLLVGDWDGSKWVTRLACGSESNNVHKMMSEDMDVIIEEFECIADYQVDKTPIALSDTTIANWESSATIMTVDKVEDFGNVNLNAHIRVESGFEGDSFTLRLLPEGIPGISAPWLEGMNGGIANDPHIKTWNGTWYDYQGACDLVFLHAPNFHSVTGASVEESMALDIHVRTKGRYGYSYIESAVVRLGGDTFQVDSFGGYFLNGISAADLTSATLGGFPISHTQLNTKQHVFRIDLGPGEDLVISNFKDMVSVKVDNADQSRFLNSVGLMGEFGGKDRLIGRDGVTEITDPNALGQEWQVRDDEDMLFQIAQDPQYPEKCHLPDAEASVSENRRLRGVGAKRMTKKDAEKACAHWKNKAACVSDVMKTGDLDIAVAEFL